MTVIDTNVIIRFVTRDDTSQFKAARSLLAREVCFIHVTVTLEVVWVLENVEQALQGYESGLDFADALHRALAPPSADALATFDQAFIDQASDTDGCPVVLPANA